MHSSIKYSVNAKYFFYSFVTLFNIKIRHDDFTIFECYFEMQIIISKPVPTIERNEYFPTTFTSHENINTFCLNVTSELLKNNHPITMQL